MTLKETEKLLHYMNAVIMFKMMHSHGIINKKDLRICKETILKKYKPPYDPYEDELKKVNVHLKAKNKIKCPQKLKIEQKCPLYNFVSKLGVHFKNGADALASASFFC